MLICKFAFGKDKKETNIKADTLALLTINVGFLLLVMAGVKMSLWAQTGHERQNMHVLLFFVFKLVGLVASASQ